MKKVAVSLVLASMICLLHATGAAADDLYEAGRKIYNSNCRVCHINRMDGDQPTPYYLRFRPPDFANPSFWTGDAEKKIAETVRKGKPPMPSFPNLTADQIKALVYYLSHTFR